MHTLARNIDSVSPAQKKIKLRPQNPKKTEEILKEFKLNQVTASLLAARGYSSDSKLRNYLIPSLKEGLLSPDKIKNISAACELILEMQRKKRSVAICCDFDVDGLSGGAQLHHFLLCAGIESQVFVPDRFEDGYGLNSKMVEKIAKANFGLLITVDYGTTNINELTLARKFGLKTLVVDHHHVISNPPADVFLNPNQKGCGFADKVLSASGLVWFLILALRSSLQNVETIDCKSYLDLACLGTICDMVPLTGVNRVIAKRGLQLLGQTKRAGLIALKNIIGINREFTCTDVSFGIGPRLNAAGRMVHGDVVIQLLTSSDSEKTKKIASQLNRLNVERQEMESVVKERATQEVNRWGTLPMGIVVHDPEFHTGVIGIVAQRLVETFHRPTVVMGRDNNGIYKGSVRGIKGFSVVDALSATSEHLIKFGGHEGAGGLSVEEDKISDFTQSFIEACESRLSGLNLNPYVEADTEISMDKLEDPLIEELRSLAPFGVGNPNPVLLIKNAKIMDIKILKAAHLKVILSDGKRFVAGLIWRQTSHPHVTVGNIVHVAFRPDINTYNGTSEMQLNIQAIEKA